MIAAVLTPATWGRRPSQAIPSVVVEPLGVVLVGLVIVTAVDDIDDEVLAAVELDVDVSDVVDVTDVLASEVQPAKTNIATIAALRVTRNMATVSPIEHHGGMPIASRVLSNRWLQASACGLAMCLSLPPWGWWPLAIVGFAGLALVIDGERRRRKFNLASLSWFVHFAISLQWMRDFNIGGYIGATLLESSLLAVGCALTPRRGTWRFAGLACTLTLAEYVRWKWPFGGVPLSSLALSVADSPLRWTAPLGGSMLVMVGIALLAGAGASFRRDPTARRVTLTMLLIALAIPTTGALLPSTTVTGQMRIALVQGGGKLGTRAVTDDAHQVFVRHLTASQTIVPGSVDLVLWPENVINVDGIFETSPEQAQVAAEARRLGAPIVAGVVHDEGSCCFRNQAVVWDATGKIVDIYDKVHRVPFGEYIPLRSLVEKIADLSLIPHEAISGHKPGLLHTPAGDLAVVISFELFHPDRAASGVDLGGSVLLGPTNSSSYRDSMVPTQTLNASRLRALETGRTVTQVSPTGFAAIITANGELVARSSLKEQRVIMAIIDKRSGRTVYSHIGDGPTLAVCVVALVAISLRRRRLPVGSL